MYDKIFTRATPGCIVILLDRSDSMNRRWKGSSLTLAQSATAAVNQTIYNLGVRSNKGATVRHYFDVGVFGYGLRPRGGGEGVETALGPPFTEHGLVALPELLAHPIGEADRPSVDAGGGTTRCPMWVEPVYGEKTPMCEAIAVAGAYVNQWTRSHPDSFPPVVINVTDGWVTDSPHGGADIAEWARRLRTLSTRDGQTLLFTIFLSPDGEPPTSFPASPQGLPKPGPDLFAVSSLLPAPFVVAANANGMAVPEHGRAFSFNADESTLHKFLTVGTLGAAPGRVS